MARVLVIDDDAAVSATIRNILEKRGHPVTIAGGGHSALDALDASDFDVVMIDLIMPGTDGLDTIKIIRETSPDVPIIAMSGYAFHGGSSDLDFFQLAAALGAATRLEKPFKSQELIAVVEASCASRPDGAAKVA